MPAKNIVKQYLENGYYHLYNRGVEKRNIFLDDQDYIVFLHLLKYYLSPPDPNNEHPFANLSLTGFNPVRLRPMQTLFGEIDLLGYCLMPNHYHLLVRQITRDGITQLTRKISTTYSMYFNRRYKRVGHLFQGIFRAALIQDDSYLLHLSRYIHLNPSPVTAVTGFNPVTYSYSSYQYYLGTKNASWVKPKFILDYFQSNINSPFLPKQINSYQKFVEEYLEDSIKYLGPLILED